MKNAIKFQHPPFSLTHLSKLSPGQDAILGTQVQKINPIKMRKEGKPHGKNPPSKEDVKC